MSVVNHRIKTFISDSLYQLQDEMNEFMENLRNGEYKSFAVISAKIICEPVTQQYNKVLYIGTVFYEIEFDQ